MTARWFTPEQMLARLRTRWASGEFLRAQWEPVVTPIRAPTAAEVAADLGAAQDWVAAWKSLDPSLVRLEWRRVGGRRVGSNEVPHRAIIEKPDQLWTLLRVGRQVRRFQQLLTDTAERASALTGWMTANPMKVLAHDTIWPRRSSLVI